MIRHLTGPLGFYCRSGGSRIIIPLPYPGGRVIAGAGYYVARNASLFCSGSPR